MFIEYMHLDMYKSSLSGIDVFLRRVNAHSRPPNGLFISLEIGFPKRIVYVIIRYVQFILGTV